MHLTQQARILLYLCIKKQNYSFMEKEKLSAILSKGRNGTKGWFLYRAWPGTRSAIYVYLMSMLAAFPVGIAAALSCEFIEFLTKTTINSAWIPAIYMLAAELYMIHKCRKKFHLRVRLEKIQQMPKTIIFLLVFLVGLFQAIPMSVLERFMDLPDYMEQDFVNLAHNPIGILVLCIIAPIAEEYLFRGLMMRKMLRWNISPWYAIIGSSIMFGLIHLNPAQIPGPIILGIVMAWMCYRTKSLIPGIIIHITNNTLCLIPEECYDTYIASTPMIEGGLSLVSIAIVILSISFFNKKTAAAS
jgi:membrane protease YdiL (CAAX protease family)